jgi:hypothetical protein
VRVNYETGAGTQFKVYGGSNASLYASFTAANAIQFPGLAAASGHDCMQIDNSGYISNTGLPCATGNTNGTVNSGTIGQVAVYASTGAAVSGVNTISVAEGGTGASTAPAALSNLGGVSVTGAA